MTQANHRSINNKIVHRQIVHQEGARGAMIVIPEVLVLPSEQKAASNQGLLVKCAVMAKFYFDGRQALFPIIGHILL